MSCGKTRSAALGVCVPKACAIDMDAPKWVKS
jgi:hypothetical protein